MCDPSSATARRLFASRPPAPMIERLPRALQSKLLAFLDQATFVAAAQTSRAWQVLSALPTSVPAALRLRLWRHSDGLSSGLLKILRQSAAAAAAAATATSSGDGLRSLAVRYFGPLAATETVALSDAIRSLPSLASLDLAGSMWLDDFVRAVIVAPVMRDVPTRPILPSLRALALDAHLWNTPLVDVARAFPALTHLTISPGYLSRKMSPPPPPPLQSSSDSFATLGAEPQWQNWSALALFAHLERLTLPSKNSWHIDAPVGIGDDAERERRVAHDQWVMYGIESAAAAAASLCDRSVDRRPRLASAFSGVGELEIVDWSGRNAHPISDLVARLPRLARLVLRQCRFDPSYPVAGRRRALIANLAELVVERTHDCKVAGGVDFALRHTDVASLRMHSLLPSVATEAAVCDECREYPAVVCTAIAHRVSVGGGRDAEDAAALAAASRRPLVVNYYYDPDVCRCEFAWHPNISFVRHPTTTTTKPRG